MTALKDTAERRQFDKNQRFICVKGSIVAERSSSAYKWRFYGDQGR